MALICIANMLSRQSYDDAHVTCIPICSPLDGDAMNILDSLRQHNTRSALIEQRDIEPKQANRYANLLRTSSEYGISLCDDNDDDVADLRRLKL